MTGSHRTPEQILEHRARITELHKEGWSNQDIAKELGLPDYTVCRDLAAVRAVLYEQAVENLDEARKRELEKINLIEAEAWEQWERSKQPRVSRSVTRKGTTGSDDDPLIKSQGKSEERGGDPRYMEIILRCSEQRAKLLGLVINKVDMTSAGKPMHQIQIVEVVRSTPKQDAEAVLH